MSSPSLIPHPRRSTQSRPRRLATRARPHLDILEDRLVPSTILWTNRGSAASDTDHFNAVFGASADAARSVVDAALSAWQNVIQNFNYATGGNTFHIAINMDLSNHTNGGESLCGLATDGHGKPTEGEIDLGSGTDGHGAGWFLDANVIDPAAFGGTLVNPYVQQATPNGGAVGLGDLYSVVLHETCHNLGFNCDPGESLYQNVQGYLHSTGLPDAVDHPGMLYAFSGPDVNMLLTSDDGDSVDGGGGDHAARVGNSYTDPVSHITFTPTVDLMDPVYSWGERTLISLTDAMVLKDAYGYTVSAPPSFLPSPAAHLIATGADAGSAPLVHIYNAGTGALLSTFYAYNPSFTGGVRVATADVNGDGIPDIITAPGPGWVPKVKVFDGRTGQLTLRFYPFNPTWTGGVYVAAGDVNHDGYADIVTAPDAGGPPQVQVWSGKDGTLLFNFLAYRSNFTGGVRLAVGDVDGDGHADIITGAGPGFIGPRVKVFSGATGALIRNFMAYSPSFLGGVYVAARDLNGDHHADIITGPGAGMGPQVAVFSGLDGSLMHSFLAFAASFTGGVRVAASDPNGTGYGDIIASAGAGTSPMVNVFDGMSLALLDSYYAYDPSFQGGVFVGAR